MMKTNIAIGLLTLLFAIPVCSPANEHPDTEDFVLMDSSQRDEFLKRLAVHLDKWELRLKVMDVGKLGVQYRQGKLIEGQHELTAKTLDDLRQDIEALSRKQTLAFEVVMLVHIIYLESIVNVLIDTLLDLRSCRSFDLATPEEIATWSMGLEWAKEATSIRMELFSHERNFRAHVFARARLVDGLLEKLKQGTDQP